MRGNKQKPNKAVPNEMLNLQLSSSQRQWWLWQSEQAGTEKDHLLSVSTSYDSLQRPVLQDNQGCSKQFLNSLDYSQVGGLFLGMIAFGVVVDRLGHKWSSVATASVMFVGEQHLWNRPGQLVPTINRYKSKIASLVPHHLSYLSPDGEVWVRASLLLGLPGSSASLIAQSVEVQAQTEKCISQETLLDMCHQLSSSVPWLQLKCMHT